MDCELAVRIDVNTLKGCREGLPVLLDFLRERKIRASVFFAMGPDNIVNGIKKLFRTFIKPVIIAEAASDILKRTVGEGHDCGVHCWDHMKWQSSALQMSYDELSSELSKAVELFDRVTGHAPAGCAAPEWQVSVDSLAAQDRLGFAYCSDTRGTAPFIPRMEGVVFRTLQIPTTLPMVDEVLGRGASGDDNVRDSYLDLLEPGLNVHTVSAELEGGPMQGAFRSFLDCCIEGEISFVTLADVAARYGEGSEAPLSDVKMTDLPGRGLQAARQAP